MKPEEIITTVCNYFHVPQEAILAKTSTRDITTVRQICCFFIKEKSWLPLKKIGEFFPLGEHKKPLSRTTVDQSIQTVKDIAEVDKVYCANILNLNRIIGGGSLTILGGKVKVEDIKTYEKPKAVYSNQRSLYNL